VEFEIVTGDSIRNDEMKMTHQELHDLQKEYVKKLEEKLPWKKEQLWQLVRLLWPKIQELSNEHSDNSVSCRIQMSELANIISAIMCGDHNVEFHTGDEGVLQTLPIIGMCSALTSHFQPGYALAKIEPEISFSEAVPVGAGVVMSAKTKLGGPEKRLHSFGLTARVEGSDKELFPIPRIITMLRIADPAK